ncbi:hypothetical protein BDR07DRAFT_1396796 [Suillus spraguei]|nr:hypothetical protein BDR07DRAFT_1396796 [Suillus spraguei]
MVPDERTRLVIAICISSACTVSPQRYSTLYQLSGQTFIALSSQAFYLMSIFISSHLAYRILRLFKTCITSLSAVHDRPFNNHLMSILQGFSLCSRG